MDALNDLESLIGRLLERVREGRDAPDLRKIQSLVQNLKTEIVGGQQERHQLMAENLKLKSQIGVLEQQIALLNAAGLKLPQKPDEYIEHLGAIFVRKASGRILDTPHCRQCRAPMRAVSANVPFSCSACRIFALFRPPELHDVLLTLRRL